MYSFECCLHILSNVQKFPFPKQPEIIKKGSWKGHYTESINTLEAYSQRKMTLYFDEKITIIILSLFYLLKITVHLCPFEFINIFHFLADG